MKVQNRLNRKKNQISDFSDIYFSNYDHFCSKNCQFSMNFHYNSKNENWKNLKYDFSDFSFSNYSGSKLFSGFFFSKVVKFTWKMRNVLNQKKNHESDFSDFYFPSYGHFLVILWRHHPNFRWIFHDNSKINNQRFFLLFFSFYSAHSPPSIRTGSKLRGWGPAYP